MRKGDNPPTPHLFPLIQINLQQAATTLLEFRRSHLASRQYREPDSPLLRVCESAQMRPDLANHGQTCPNISNMVPCPKILGNILAWRKHGIGDKPALVSDIGVGPLTVPPLSVGSYVDVQRPTQQGRGKMFLSHRMHACLRKRMRSR